MDTFIPELDELADATLDAVKVYCDKRDRLMLEQVRAMIEALPKPEAGAEGPAGQDGLNGKDGTDSQVPGPQGERGLPGEAGRNGLDGQEGPTGKDGVDSQVPGPQGERGLPGETGHDGREGPEGARGKDGVDSQVPGPQGERGLPGEAGRDGRDGQEGTPGRDALQLHVLDGIDSTRCYRRGTYAHHNGGLVCAFRNTDAFAGDLEKAGWQMIVNGIANVGEEQLTLTDGRVVKLAPVYRGVFDPQAEYARGEMVTYRGSTWHCNAKTSEPPGNGSTCWTLAVKGAKL